MPSNNSGNGKDDEEFFTRIQASTAAYLVDSNAAVEEIQSERNAVRETCQYLQGLVQARQVTEGAAELVMKKTVWINMLCDCMGWLVG